MSFFTVDSNSIAEEIIAHTVDMLVRPDARLFRLLIKPSRKEYLGDTQKLVHRCLDTICSQQGTDYQTLAARIETRIQAKEFNRVLGDIIEALGEDGYRKFVTLNQTIFLDVSRQLLQHLHSKGLIASQDNM